MTNATPTPADIERFHACLARVEAAGNTPAALWPAGRFTRALQPSTRDAAGVIAYIIDDNPKIHGQRFAGYEVVSREEALKRGIKAVIGCAEPGLQDTLFANRGPFRASGMQVLWCPGRFAGKPWDDGLCDLWDYEQAKRAGLNPAWPHVYPPADHALPPKYAAYLKHLVTQTGGSVLEVGSGHGLVTAELIEHAARYRCVDFSERLLFEVIEHRFAEHTIGDEPKLTLHHDETATLAEIPDGSVDLALSFDVFVHLHPDVVHQYLTSFKRVLKPGGRIALHLRMWDAAEIGVWEDAYRHEYPGQWAGMGYNSIETLSASAEHLGLAVHRVEDDGKPLLDGWTGYLVELSA